MGNAVSIPVIEAVISDLIENNRELIDKITSPKKPYTLPSPTKNQAHRPKLVKEYVFADTENKQPVANKSS